jgi:hypothetical protein
VVTHCHVVLTVDRPISFFKYAWELKVILQVAQEEQKPELLKRVMRGVALLIENAEYHCCHIKSDFLEHPTRILHPLEILIISLSKLAYGSFGTPLNNSNLAYYNLLSTK